MELNRRAIQKKFTLPYGLRPASATFDRLLHRVAREGWKSCSQRKENPLWPLARNPLLPEYRKYADDPFAMQSLQDTYPPLPGYINIALRRRVRYWKSCASREARALWYTNSLEDDVADIFNLRLLFGEEPLPQPCHVPLYFTEDDLYREFRDRKCVTCRHHLSDTPGMYFVDGHWRPRLNFQQYGDPIPDEKVYYYFYI